MIAAMKSGRCSGLMAAYLVRRLLLVIPTLFGIITINFRGRAVRTGGPVEQMIAEFKGRGGGVVGRHDRRRRSRSRCSGIERGTLSRARGLDRDAIADIKRMFGFDKPAPERFRADAARLPAL